MESIEVNVNPKDYFSKMSKEDCATIIEMCLNQLTDKVKELKDLYMQLAKTYNIEIGMSGITCLVQVSANNLSIQPTVALLGTADGIKNGLAKLTVQGIAQLAEMNKENADVKEQG